MFSIPKEFQMDKTVYDRFFIVLYMNTIQYCLLLHPV